MAKKKFRSAAKARTFQSPTARLQASRGEIERDTQRRVEAIELQARQLQAQAKTHIQGIVNAAQFEEGVLKEKNKLESKVRSHKLEALRVKRDTHVQALQDKATWMAKDAQRLAELAPKQARAAETLFKGVHQLGDTMIGINQWEQLEGTIDPKTGKSMLQTLIDGKADANYNIVWDATNDTFKVTTEGDPDAANALTDRTIRLSSHWAQKKFASWAKDNKEALRRDIVANLEKRNENGEITGIPYDEWNAIQTQEFGALALLKRLGISNNSKVGYEIFQQFRSMGALDKEGFWQGRMVDESTKRREDLRNAFFADKATDKDRTLSFNNLILATKNSYYLENGQFIDPSKSGGKYATMGDAYKDALIDLYSHGITKGTITANNIDKYDDGLTIIGSKTELWKSKFPIKHAEAREEGMKLLEKQIQNNERQKKLNGEAHYQQIQVKGGLRDQITADGKTTLTEIGKVNDYIIENGIGSKEAAKIMRLFGYVGSDYDANGTLSNIIRAGNTGDFNQVIEIWTASEGGLTGKQKAFLSKHVYFYQKLNEAHRYGKKTGIEQVRLDIENRIKPDFREKSRFEKGPLSNEAQKVVDRALEVYLKKFRARLIYQEGFTGAEEAGVFKDKDNAKEISDQILKELDTKLEDSKEIEFKNGDWVRGDGSPAQEFDYYRPKVGPRAFPRLGSKAENDATILGALNEYDHVVYNSLSVVPWETKHIDHIVESAGVVHGDDIIEYALNHKNFEDPQAIDAYVRYLKALKKGDVSAYGLEPQLNNLNYLWEKMPCYGGKKPTKTVLKRDLLKARFGSDAEKFLPPLDVEDQQDIQTDETCPVKSARNITNGAYAIVQAIKAQRLSPMGKMAHNTREGLNRDQAYMQSHPDATLAQRLHNTDTEQGLNDMATRLLIQRMSA